MEKLICTACGAPLSPDTGSPFITCEYCDTAIENPFYVEPAVSYIKQTAADEISEAAVYETPEEETSVGGSLLKTILGVGTAIAANRLRNQTSTAHRPVVHTPAARRISVRGRHPSTLHTTVTRHPQPQHPGPGMRPVRPGKSRPTGGGRSPGAMGGRGGRHR